MLPLSLLGSTGSIGRQTLEIIQKNRRYFQVQTLGCRRNIDLLFKQIYIFKPKFAFVADAQKARQLQKRIGEKSSTRILTGDQGLKIILKDPATKLVINAISGTEGLKSTLLALRNKKHLALANKESLVLDGKKIIKLAQENKVELVPIDSEHTAIFDILRNFPKKKIKQIILPCSGGPFFGKKINDLKKVTLKQVLNHPRWKNMGPKITVDSATLVNKGFEVIESAYLYHLKPEQIKVVIHPEAIIHAIVIFSDGTLAFRASQPDMRIPIQYVLNYFLQKLTGKQIKSKNLSNNNISLKNLHFFPPDPRTFLGLKYAYSALKKDGDFPARFCLANEQAVQNFLSGKIKFSDIYNEIKKALPGINS